MADILDMKKLESLPHPLSVMLVSGDVYEVTLLCVETGCMYIDVCGKTQLGHFDNVLRVIDADGFPHSTEDFWVEGEL